MGFSRSTAAGCGPMCSGRWGRNTPSRALPQNLDPPLPARSPKPGLEAHRLTLGPPRSRILEHVYPAEPGVGAVAAHRQVGHLEVHVDLAHRPEEVLPLLALRRREAGIDPPDRWDAARLDRLGVLGEEGANGRSRIGRGRGG